MRHLRVLNLVCNYRNLLFLTQTLHLITSALRFFCVCVARVWRTSVLLWYVCMWHLARSRVRQDMTCAQVKMKGKK